MRSRPPKHVRDQLKHHRDLSDLVLKGDYEAARREAERVQRLQRDKELRAAEWQRRQDWGRGNG